MKRLFSILIVLAVLPLSLYATTIGISLGTFDAEKGSGFLDGGTHVQLGVVSGITPRWEAEAFIMTEATPEPFGETVGALVFSYAVLGAVYENDGTVPLFANAYVGFGFMGDIMSGSHYGPVIRITPISVGGPQFLLRERTFTFGAYYNIPRNSVALFWNIFTLDFFL